MPLTRRRFLGGVAAMGAALAARVSAGQDAAGADAPKTLPTRRLGRTELVVPVLGLGGFHVGQARSERDARLLVDTALAEGVRFFDTAEQYQAGKSERWLGAALKELRKDVVLMTKTYAPDERSAESARKHLEGSLERLGTDYLDIWQLHSIKTPEDVDRAFGPGGAMAYILGQKEAGVVRHVGVTGHVNPKAHLRALEYWDKGFRYDTVQMPINPIDVHQVSFQKEVLPALVERDIGVLAMKTQGSGALIAQGICTPAESLRYVLGLPVDVLIVGMETPEQVRANAAVLREQGALDAEARAALAERIAPRAALSLEWYKSA